MADKENPRTGCRATESQRRLWNECLHAGARQNFPRMFFARACPNRTTTRIRTRHAQTLCESHRFRRKDQRSEADRARRLSRRIAATPRALTNVSSRDASRVEGYSEFLGLHTQKMWIFSCASSSSDWMKARKITEIELCEKRKKRARCQRVPPSNSECFREPGPELRPILYPQLAHFTLPLPAAVTGCNSTASSASICLTVGRLD